MLTADRRWRLCYRESASSPTAQYHQPILQPSSDPDANTADGGLTNFSTTRQCQRRSRLLHLNSTSLHYGRIQYLDGYHRCICRRQANRVAYLSSVFLFVGTRRRLPVLDRIRTLFIHDRSGRGETPEPVEPKHVEDSHYWIEIDQSRFLARHTVCYN